MPSNRERPGRRLLLALLLAGVMLSGFTAANGRATEPPVWALVIHGGAGTILPENMDGETEAAYRAALNAALTAGAAVLADGHSSLDAVETTIRLMENSPLFNAGKGAVFTDAGQNEMDASIMSGLDHNAGAVAGVKTIRNPISAARAVMEKSPHVMMTNEGAEAFAAAQGLDIVEPAYFYTERRWRSYLKARQDAAPDAQDPEAKHGTVGCVALDQAGNIAAGTSTGGMTLKMWGRVGDSPIIGAGTYADNATCGVSATGHGEFFIRNVVAYDIAARMAYAGLGLQQAAEQVVLRKLVAQQADGGIIALDARGNIAMVFNTAGMYRGYRKSDGTGTVAIFGE